jgi:predicted acylesterase/phospholipase RssA
MTGSIRVRLSANQAVWSDQELQTLMDPTVEYSLAHYWKPCSFGLAEAGAILGALLPPGPIPTTAAGGPLDDLFDDRWPQRDMWLSAVRIDDGSRVMFGREGDPVTDVPTAVAASCALPGWFTPVVVDEQWYIDGAMWSATNAEVLAEYDLDGVVISAPLSGWMTPCNDGTVAISATRCASCGRRAPPSWSWHDGQRAPHDAGSPLAGQDDAP